MNSLKAKFEKPKTKAQQEKEAREQAPKLERIPHVTKLMALAIRLESLLNSGIVANQTEIARHFGITNSRVTQIINLTYLAPDIQQAILELEPTTETREPFLERDARSIATDHSWSRQRKRFAKLMIRHKN